MKTLNTLIILVFITVSGCGFGDTVGPGSYNDPFYYGNRIVYDGYTYINNSGSSTRNLQVSFTSIGNSGYIQNEQAIGVIDSTFRYSETGGQTSLMRVDTLYFNKTYNGDIRFFSFGYYRVVPKWIDLFRFSSVNVPYVQDINEVLYGQRWAVRITSNITTTTIYTGFSGNLPVYRLEQRLQYTSPFNADLTFYWYWNEQYGLMVYDELRNGLIYQVARSKNY